MFTREDPVGGLSRAIFTVSDEEPDHSGKGIFEKPHCIDFWLERLAVAEMFH